MALAAPGPNAWTRALRAVGLNKRSSVPAEWANNPDLAALWRTWQTATGRQITVDNALRASAFLACARVIAEGVAQVPRTLRKRDKADATGRTWAIDESHWLAQLMRQPNEWQTGYEFVELLTFHAVVTGDGFAWKNQNVLTGRITELIPLNPPDVTVTRLDGGALRYTLRAPGGAPIDIPARDIFHLRGPSWTGVRGLPAFDLAREAIGLALATEESHARMHGNGVRLSGVLTSEMPLSTEAAERIRTAWNETYSSPENWHKVAVLEGAMKFVPFSQTGADAQHLETRRFQIEEVCRFMRVNPLMVMQSDKTQAYASIEQFFLSHTTHTLGPWIERWAGKADTSLLARSSEPNTWLHFDLKGLAPADSTVRSAYLSSGVNAGWLTRNEAREMEGRNPLPGLDEPLAPVNLQPKPEGKPDAANPQA